MKKLLIILICLIGCNLMSAFAHPPKHHVPPQQPYYVYLKPTPKVPHKQIIIIDKPVYKPRIYVAPVLPPPPPPVYVEPIIIVPEPKPIIEFKFKF